MDNELRHNDPGLFVQEMKMALSMMNVTPELKLMLALIQADWDSKPLLELLATDTAYDWQLFYQLALHHKAYPVLFTSIQKYASDWIPMALIQSLQQKYMQNTIEMLHLSAETAKVSKELTDRGIRNLMLKGPVLAELLYGDLSMRTSKDIDVLVPIESVNQAEEILLQCGFEIHQEKPRILNDWKWRDHHSSYFHPKSRVQVELHWRLNPDTGSEPDFDTLWNRRQQVTVAGSSRIDTLGDNDMLLYLLSHGARHGWFRLRWLMDLDVILRRVPHLEALKPLAQTYRAEALVGQTLWLCYSVLHTPIGNDSIPFLKHRRAFKLAFMALDYIKEMVQLSPQPATKPLQRHYRKYSFVLMSPPERIKFVLSRLYPRSADAKSLPLPKALHFLYFVIRPFLLVWRRMKPNRNPIRYGEAPYETHSDLLKKTARL